ncbi:MAG: GNAT family N-acetyltransferase [Candidatus Nanopelagicaceae bacterium]|nr:GNAT family N-acetyltransferase [Candidatus Nanopelagicaceae bacterium]
MSLWSSTEPIIETELLELHHICAQDLITLFEEPENLVIYEGKSYSNPYRQLMDESGPLAWRVPQVKVDPSLNKWFVRWIVFKESGEIIGSISFHGAPDSNGMIEVGLGIQEKFRNQGFAREALRGFWLWALQFPEVKIFRYTVSPTNLPSIRVVDFFGFEYKGEQMDEIDGPENIYEISREEFLQKFVHAEIRTDKKHE